MKYGNKDKIKILIVEDEAIIAMSIEQILLSQGYEVIGISSTGESALKITKKNKPDLALIDIILSGELDGIDVAAALKDQHDIPIVYLTAHSDDTTLLRAMATEPHGYILKPIKQNDLHSAIELALYKHFNDKKLRESEEKYRLLAENSSDVIWTMDFNGKFTYVSPSVKALAGYAPEEVLNIPLKDCIPPQYIEPVMREIAEELAKPADQRVKSRKVELQQYTKDGSVIDVEATMTWLHDESGNAIGIQGSTRDITDRKNAQKLLLDTEERYTSLCNNISDCIYKHDLEGNFLDVNPAGLKLFGYTSDEIRSLKLSSIMDEDLANLTMENIKELKKTGKIQSHFEAKLYKKNGDPVYVDVIVTPFYRDNTLYGIQGIARDITGKKLEYDSRVTSESRFRSMIDQSPIGMLIFDTSGSLIYLNDSLRDMLELDEKDADQLFTNYNILKDEGIKKYMPFIQRGFDGKSSVLPPMRFNPLGKPPKESQNELENWYRGYVFPITRENGGVIEIIFALDNITDLKLIEEAYHESEMRFRELSDLLPQAIFELDEKGFFTYMNRFGYRHLGYDSTDIAMGHHVTDLVADEDSARVREDIQTISAGIYDMSFQYTGRKKNGDLFPIIIYPSPVIREGRLTGYRGIVIDDTVRKTADLQLRAALQEKELLLKEIHHRVKNNMQIISSILNLQSNYVRDEKDLEFFIDCQSRVRSMALVHEKLYQSNDFTEIDFHNYITNLVNEIKNSYNHRVEDIETSIEAKNIYLDINRAIPCALLINELVSNAIKHAFPGDKAGKISIQFKKNKKSGYNLTVSDNGIGIANGINAEKSNTLGLKLIDALALQLKGTISISTRRGTKFTISFPL